jgi:hypothetical protein
MQPRHFARLERTVKIGLLPFRPGAIDLSALDPLEQLILEHGQDPIAMLRLLPMFLIIIQPESCLHPDEDEE